MTRPLVVWRFTDGKAGHENQTAGLLAALRERVPVDDYIISTADCRKGLVACITGHDPFGEDRPSPDFIIGAGHATHLPMLNARRVRGGRVVVLMKPSLPAAWFDLCVIPAHDRPRRTENVLVTRGVLNRVRYSGDRNPEAGLILVGGPSSHVNWSNESIAAQVCEIVERKQDMKWTLATSRRTPAGFTGLLNNMQAGNLTTVPHEKTTPEWLPGQLAGAAVVWVSEDSVSMVFEALTSGAAVGLLAVDWRKPAGRLAQGVRTLQRDGLVVGFDDWRNGTELKAPVEPFDEAGRCANWLLERWPIDV
jgi:mitochondrial fission protein ELM1